MQLLPQAAMGGALVLSAGLGVPPSPRAHARCSIYIGPPPYAGVPGGTPGTALGTSALPTLASRGYGILPARDLLIVLLSRPTERNIDPIGRRKILVRTA